MIIIETPAPPTRERLVLVRQDAVPEVLPGRALVASCLMRDATPEDLERAGYVERARLDAAERANRARRPSRREPRATDEELVSLARKQDFEHGEPSPRNIALAVAARVRREQCLVTRAVEAGLDIEVAESDESAGRWDVVVRVVRSHRALARDAVVEAAREAVAALDDLARVAADRSIPPGAPYADAVHAAARRSCEARSRHEAAVRALVALEAEQ